MSALTTSLTQMPSDHSLHETFLALLPRIETHARIRFRHVRCPGRRDDLVGETIALAWAWFVSLARRGKDASAFPTALASLAVRAVWSGRRLCGQEKSRDALSPLAQQRHGFHVDRLAPANRASFDALYSWPRGQKHQDAFEERLADNTRTPVPEQAAFRCDFPTWLDGLSDRDRRVVGELMRGERTGDVARRLGLTPGRVSQLRRQLSASWQAFCGDLAEWDAGAVPAEAV